MILFHLNGKVTGVEEIQDSIKKCLDFIQNNDMNKIEKGIHLIEDKDLYVNIAAYRTKDEGDCIWEAHRQYLDLHYMIHGEEKIKIGNLSDMKVLQYVEEQDYLSVEGSDYTEIILKQDGLLLLYPEDVHKTAISNNNIEMIKKAIFKIRIL